MIRWPAMSSISTVDQMLECKRNVRAPLALQPYIMALVLYVVEDFYGVREIRHQASLPFRSDEAFVKRPHSP